MNMKRMLSLLLALVMMLALCACGGNDQEEAPAADAPAVDAPVADAPEADAPADEPVDEPVDDRITYTVTIVDEEGNPFAGTMVQMCQGENCVPTVTDASGVATFKMAEEADYEVKLIQMPEGYAYAEDAEVFHFAAGSYEMTITLKAVA